MLGLCATKTSNLNNTNSNSNRAMRLRKRQFWTFLLPVCLFVLLYYVSKRDHVVRDENYKQKTDEFLQLYKKFSEQAFEAQEDVLYLDPKTNTEKDEKIIESRPTACPIKWDKKITRSENPILNLNRRKFLLPLLINGPNNQLVGFRKTLIIAVKLNRTIVIPRFFKHRTSSDINTQHRLDLNVLSQLTPFITLEEYRDVCNNRADAIFRTREMNTAGYRRVERELNISVLNDKSQLYKNTVEYPLDMSEATEKGLLLFETHQIKQMYTSSKKCAVHPFQFSNLRIGENAPKGNAPTEIDLKKMSDVRLYSEVVRFSPFPPHIKQLAQDFNNLILKKRTLMSIHWRYNKEDWMISCNEKRAPKSRMEMCRKILSFKPEHIAEGIAIKMNGVNVSDVYIAAPPSQLELLLEVKKILKEKHNFRMHCAKDLMDLWKQRYQLCEWLWKDENDLLSSTEMEICSSAKVFLRSSASSWSNNVIMARPKEISTLDEGIYELVIRAQAMSKPIPEK